MLFSKVLAFHHAVYFTISELLKWRLIQMTGKTLNKDIGASKESPKPLDFGYLFSTSEFTQMFKVDRYLGAGIWSRDLHPGGRGRGRRSVEVKSKKTQMPINLIMHLPSSILVSVKINPVQHQPCSEIKTLQILLQMLAL